MRARRNLHRLRLIVGLLAVVLLIPACPGPRGFNLVPLDGRVLYLREGEKITFINPHNRGTPLEKRFIGVLNGGFTYAYVSAERPYGVSPYDLNVMIGLGRRVDWETWLEDFRLDCARVRIAALDSLHDAHLTTHWIDAATEDRVATPPSADCKAAFDLVRKKDCYLLELPFILDEREYWVGMSICQRKGYGVTQPHHRISAVHIDGVEREPLYVMGSRTMPLLFHLGETGVYATAWLKAEGARATVDLHFPAQEAQGVMLDTASFRLTSQPTPDLPRDREVPFIALYPWHGPGPQMASPLVEGVVPISPGFELESFTAVFDTPGDSPCYWLDFAFHVNEDYRVVGIQFCSRGP